MPESPEDSNIPENEYSPENKNHRYLEVVDLYKRNESYSEKLQRINNQLDDENLSNEQRETLLKEEEKYSSAYYHSTREYSEKLQAIYEAYGKTEIGEILNKAQAESPDASILNSVPSSGSSSTYPVEEGQESVLADGTRIIKNADGTTTTISPDGRTIKTDAAGNIIPESGSLVGSGLKTEPAEQEGKDLYETIAKLTHFTEIEAIAMNNGFKTKIDCFFVHKYFMDKENTVHFQYGKEVTSLSITNSASRFGTSATVTILDNGGMIPSILEYQSSYYFVIAIMDVVDSDESGEHIHEEGIFYQPYVFDISNINILSDDKTRTGFYNINLLDIVSSTLEKVSYGNLLLEYPTFLNAQHFGELYFTLIDFAGTIIHLNHNKKYHISKNVYFINDITDNINEIIKNVVLADRTIDMSCYTIMNHIFKHAVREIVPPASFKGDKPGNLLLPILLFEEYDPIDNSYRSYFNRDTKIKMLDEMDFSSKKYEISVTYVKRAYFARGIDMAFELAFNKKSCILFECLNPKLKEDGTLHDDENKFTFMNGFSITELNNIVQFPPDNQMTGILWKNLMLLNDTPSGTANFLIFFNWIYEIYKSKFLNYDESYIGNSMRLKMKPANIPYFLELEKNKLLGGDPEVFAKTNSVTIRLKSLDIIKEGLYHVGRTLKSYIFLNALTGFKTKLNILRRPCEIIKINNNSSDSDVESLQKPIGGMESMKNGFSLMYMTQITHTFEQNKATDTIHANRICELESS